MILVESWGRFLVLALSLALVVPAWSQGVHPKSGRRIAAVMGVGGADWLEREEREREESPTKAIELLALKPGMVVADIGAGVGYYTTRMARRVGPTGKVYAADIQPEMLTILRKRLEERKLTNVETVLSTETDPKLPANTLDLALMVDVYHELGQPQRVLRKIHQALKDDGRLILLEYRKEDPYVPIRIEHKMSVAEAKLELEDEGFVLDQVIPGLPWQHILVFRKAPKP
jgi:SAM-dependent methyltransferase